MKFSFLTTNIISIKQSPTLPTGTDIFNFELYHKNYLT